MLRITVPITWCLLALSLLPSSTESFVTPIQNGIVKNPLKSLATTSTYRRAKSNTKHGLQLMSPMEDGDRTRKRDRFKRHLAHRIRYSSSTGLPRRSYLSPLQGSKKDDNNEGEKYGISNIPKTIAAFKDDVSEKIVALIPPKIMEVITNVWNKLVELLPAIKIGFVSFAAGAALMLGAIFIPVYSSVEKLSEPVTLFETILADLDQGYVDEVDTKKLFETGISAMLNSLDPYTEFEAREEAEQLNEGIRGKYGGVGLVISGTTPKDVARLEREASASPSDVNPSKLLPKDAIDDSASSLQDGDMSSSISQDSIDDDEDDFDSMDLKEERRALKRAQDRGIRVVSAFEGYAFDYGMRVGDKIVAVDDTPITKRSTVEDVRNLLRGDPGTLVSIKFERDGVKGVQEITMPRTIVQLRDVKLATLVGDPKDCIGYVSLTGFSQNAGPEMRQAIYALERAAEDATNGESSLKGLILDLRGNPGGLLTSAVEVSSMLVPNGSDIVSAKGRGFPGVLYRSRVDPILEPNTKLAVLVNRGTASAAEIVSGAVQDLDAGIIVGTDRTFGKGLVQNVEDLPFNTALKFTVAKYYTPSGRCIQGINYAEGGKESAGKYKSSKVLDGDRQNFFTKRGRIVKDGGGIEADYKVPAPKASALEVTLLRSDVLGEFAAQWSRKHELNSNFEVDSQTYKEFQDFVFQKQKAGDIKLDALYSGALNDLQRALKQSGYKGSEKDVDQLRASIVREIKKDFDKYAQDIKEDIANSILARYVPESMLLMRGLKTDKQVQAATRLINNGRSFNSMLAKGSMDERASNGNIGSRLDVASTVTEDSSDAARLKVEW